MGKASVLQVAGVAANLRELYEQPEGTPVGEGAFIVGEKIFCRTVTFYLTGKIVGGRGPFLLLENAAWIADTGQFGDAINKGTLAEFESVDVPVRVNIHSMVDVFPWLHDLP